MTRYFGTDGIRGKFGVAPLDIQFMLRLGNAVARSLVQPGGTVVIGRDTRVSGEAIEAALSAGLQAAGVTVQLAGIMPTPGIAYLTRKYKADLGIVVSASHNPYFDNGIKFFNAQGGKLSDEEQNSVEQALATEITTLQDKHVGRSYPLFTAQNDYHDFVLSTVSRLSLDDMCIVIDSGHGAMYRIAPRVFEELSADVKTIGSQPDGFNINKNCGSTDTEALAMSVKTHQADIGLAFDGDGDRLVVIDNIGEPVDGDELLFILATHAHSESALEGPVVGTAMTNMGLEMAFGELGIDFQRARVGDKHVLEMLAETGGRFGGETSGHLICLNQTTTGDGLIAATQLLKIISSSKKSINELKKGFKKYPQVIVNVNVTDKKSAIEHAKTKLALQEAQSELGDFGRIVLRPSGTEPVIRVMVEAENAGLTTKLAHEIADTIKSLSL